MTDFNFALHTMMVPVPKDDGTTIDLPMRVLSGAEDMEVKKLTHNEIIKTFATAPKKDDISNYDELYRDRFMYWTIFYALRDPRDQKKRFFETIQMVNDLPLELIAILSNHYLMVKLNQKYIQHISFDDEDTLQQIFSTMQSMPQDPEFYLNSLSDLSMINLLKYIVSKYTELKQEHESLLPTQSGQSSDTVSDSE